MASPEGKFNAAVGKLKRKLMRSARIPPRDRAHWDRNLIQSLSRARLPSWRQIRHLPEVLSKSDGARLIGGIMLVLFGSAVLAGGFYLSRTHVVPAVGGAIVEGAIGTPRSLNPLLAVSNDVDMDLTRLMFSRLFTTDASGAVVPDLVDRFTISEDQKTYDITLRDDVAWHDGTKLTADDVVFTFGLIQDPAWLSPLHPSFRDVTVEKTGEHALRFTLKEPFAPFRAQLTFGIMPMHIWKDVAAANASQSEYALKPVGSGPFRFDSMKRDRRGFVMSYTVVRNADYYRRAPYIESITFRFYPDGATALDALRQREVHSLSFVPRDLGAELSEMSQIVPIRLELPQYTAVFFNPNKNEALKDKAVRNALNQSVDKARIILDVLRGEGHPLDGPALPRYVVSASTTIPYAPDEAKDAIEAYAKKAGAPLKITLTTVDQPEAMAVARIVKDGWTEAGAEVTIAAIPPADILRSTVKPREYEALLYGQLLGADPDPYPFWHSTQVQDPGLNLAMFAHRNADAAIEAARRATNPETRQEQYVKFAEVIAAEQPAVFLYSPSYTYPIPAAMKGFTGAKISNPSDRFATVTDWYLETERAWK